MCFAFLHLIIEVEVFDCQNLQSVLSQRNIPTFSVLLVKKSLPLWSVHFYQCKAIKSACPSKMRWLADLISDWREIWHFPKKIILRFDMNFTFSNLSFLSLMTNIEYLSVLSIMILNYWKLSRIQTCQFQYPSCYTNVSSQNIAKSWKLWKSHHNLRVGCMTLLSASIFTSF